MSRRPPFGKGGFGAARKTKVLCPKAEDKKIPVVPPQFTACAASGIPIDPQSCIGLTRLHLLLFSAKPLRKVFGAVLFSALHHPAVLWKKALGAYWFSSTRSACEITNDFNTSLASSQ
jgi:hypothetical protein